MDVRKRAWIGLCAAIILVGLAGTAEAFYIDDKNTLSFTSKLQTRVSFRLQNSDTPTWTQPEVSVGDLAQWRNLALLEVDHDLKELIKSLDILYPLKKWKIRSKYHIVGRFMYEAVYDVGSDNLKAVRDNDKENIDSFKQAYDLWEAYIDFSRGPAFVRLGRQSLAWGETDIFRLLDQINPLDNSFGGPFEDLDDRRIPLWMLRGKLQPRLGRPGRFPDRRGLLGAGQQRRNGWGPGRLTAPPTRSPWTKSRSMTSITTTPPPRPCRTAGGGHASRACSARP